MTRDEFVHLYEKCEAGNCTPAETALLRQFQDDFNLSEHPWNPTLMGSRDDTGQAIYSKIMTASKNRQQIRIQQMRRIWLPAAAVLLLVMTTLIYMRSAKGRAGTGAIAGNLNSRYKNDVLPGGNKAMLTLANGSSILLDSAQKGLLTQQGNANVIKTNNGQLSYKANSLADAPVSFNTISTPRGGQYQVILPDGSSVWLNAASSLRFPTAFTTRERRVELSGEGYFAITKDPARPFKVAVLPPPETGGGNETSPQSPVPDRLLEVEVLGTEFNVKAYRDEAAISTTLVEGAVILAHAGKNWLLHPGQKASLESTGTMRMDKDADVDEATAWKNGRFEFNGNIKDIMRQIARWYDVEVKYEDNVSDKSFVFATPRTANVSEVLKILELTGSIHFLIEDRTITVMP
jgi:transmembrane sensor